MGAACRVFPTLIPSTKTQTLLSTKDGTGSGWSLCLTPDGRLQVDASGKVFQLDKPLPLRQWTLAWLSLNATKRQLTLGYRVLLGGRGTSVTLDDIDAALFTTGADSPLMIASAEPALPQDHFNGRLESPCLWNRSLADEDIESLISPEPNSAVQDAFAWDFSLRISSDDIIGTGKASGLDGHFVNAPARAVKGSSWSGKEMNFAHAPGDYGAVHFHEDDMVDCGWPACWEWAVPEGTRSGLYALFISAEGSGAAEENVPFHVVPRLGSPGAPLAVLASTFTYTVYGNHARPEFEADPHWRRDWEAQVKDWGAYPHNPVDHPDLGLSTYNRHPDGTGIHIASHRRPMLNVRVGYLTFPRPALHGSGLRHLPADSHLIAWLEDQAIPYDIITDAELHKEGYALLKHYQVDISLPARSSTWTKEHVFQAVLTGTHPEYVTAEMLDALTSFRDSGGRLAYLGGNGFYWRVAVSGAGLIEIRRGEGGIRAWASEPGEYYQQLDGAYGGLWRRSARPPQALVGVGFAAQATFTGTAYRRTPKARDPRVAWLFQARLSIGFDCDGRVTGLF